MSLKNLSAIIKIPKLLKNKLHNKKINQIYNKFEKSLKINENFVVAVSGGPDSLSLAFLAKIYSIKKGLSAKFFIVDHKLRSNSTKEALFVKKLLKKISVSSEILIWKGKKPEKNIQSIARVERYRLLLEKCNKLKINNILLGHHQDDLIENFFIRMLRGSGLKGLISLDEKSKIDNKNLIRPLIGQRKEDLVFLSEAIFNFYVKDPSNEDEKFLRIRVRHLISQLKKDGLDKKKLTKTIKNLKLSDKVIDFYVKENMQKNAVCLSGNKRIILSKHFFSQPYEVIFRGLSEFIKLVGKRFYQPRGKKIDNIINYISNNKSIKVTLGGCIIQKVNQTVIIKQEY